MLPLLLLLLVVVSSSPPPVLLLTPGAKKRRENSRQSNQRRRTRVSFPVSVHSNLRANGSPPRSHLSDTENPISRSQGRGSAVGCRCTFSSGRSRLACSFDYDGATHIPDGSQGISTIVSPLIQNTDPSFEPFRKSNK